MDEAQKKALIETLKSLGRGLWFGFLGLLVVALLALVSSGAISDINVVINGITINLSFVLLAVIGFIAKSIDTYVHNNQKIAANGIAPAFLQK